MDFFLKIFVETLCTTSLSLWIDCTTSLPLFKLVVSPTGVLQIMQQPDTVECFKV